jgi:hypothetical protein
VDRREHLVHILFIETYTETCHRHRPLYKTYGVCIDIRILHKTCVCAIIILYTHTVHTCTHRRTKISRGPNYTAYSPSVQPLIRPISAGKVHLGMPSSCNVWTSTSTSSSLSLSSWSSPADDNRCCKKKRHTATIVVSFCRVGASPCKNRNPVGLPHTSLFRHRRTRHPPAGGPCPVSPSTSRPFPLPPADHLLGLLARASSMSFVPSPPWQAKPGHQRRNGSL